MSEVGQPSLPSTTPSSPRSFRAKLRHATFIDPQTATKSKRTFSLISAHDNTTLGLIADTDGSGPSHLTNIDHELQTDLNRFYWRDGAPTAWERAKVYALKSWGFMCSDTGISMLKCALAYLLGSMATFVPLFSSFFGRQDSKHMVATITVYFHPARSLGSMFDASILASIAFLYTAFVSLVSMSVSVLFTDYFHMDAVGHFLVLVLFVGGGLGFVGWVKLKLGDPLVNISCSLTSLSLITILTKEGAVQEGNYSFYKIIQILKMIVVGVVITMLVSSLVFPQSGRKNVKKTMTQMTDQLSDLLGIITKSFISGDEQDLTTQDYEATSSSFKSTSGKAAQNLKEAKYEHHFFGDERLVPLELKLAGCLQRIGQSIGGLRSAAAMQFVITKESLDTTDPRKWQDSASWYASPRRSSQIKQSIEREGTGKFSVGPSSTTISEMALEEAEPDPSRHRQHQWRLPQEIFELFIEHLGPSMRSLAYTLKEILDDLPFDPENGYRVSNNPRFELSLERALTLYRANRQEALKAVYDKKDLDRTRPIEVEADWEEAAACCGHFSFCLLEVAQDIKEFLHCLDRYQVESEEARSGKSWNWLRFWRRSQHQDRPLSDPLFHHANQSTLKDVPDPSNRQARDRQYWVESQKAWWKQSLFRKTYNLLVILGREDNRFGIKVGFGALLYALPAYIPQTRPIYSQWRGEWGLLSYMLVCSMTIGASNTTGVQRFVGTGLGAILALLVWQVSNDNPVALAFFGFVMAYWTAWIIIGKGKGPMGRFIMLTYNLSCLYAYSLLMADDLYDDDGDEEDGNSNPLVMDIAMHRVVAVLTGVIWGLIITRAVWPISARQKLKDGVSLLWLRMGLIWKRDPLAVFTEGELEASYMNLSEENDLQRFLAKLQGLIDASTHEFELRRPFPQKTYERILKSTARMLEAFHAINVVIRKDMTASPGEMALIQATAAEREELCGRLSHHYSVLASSVKLECSLSTDILPSTDSTRDRLLATIFAYRKEDGDNSTPRTNDEDYSLLYTYALVTGQLAREVKICLKEVEDLFGVLDEESLMLQ